MKFYLALLLFCFSISYSQQTGSFDISIDFAGSARDISLYVPSDYDSEQAYEVFIGLHGMGDNSKNYRNVFVQNNLTSQLENTIWVFPDGGDDQSRDFYYPEGDFEIITKALQYVKDNYNINESGIILQGFSLGGRSALKYGLDNPGLFKGLLLNTPAIQGVLDGRNDPRISLGYKYENSSEIPISITHGSDDFLYINSGKILADSLYKHNCPLLYMYIDGMGHTIPANYFPMQSLYFDNPGIGLYNVDLLNFDMQPVYFTYDVSPKISFRNAGTEILNSVSFEIEVNGNINEYTYEDEIHPFDFHTIELPQVNFEVGSQTINISVKYINGAEIDSIDNANEISKDIIIFTEGIDLPVAQGFETMEETSLWHSIESGHYYSWTIDESVQKEGNNSLNMFNTILIFYNEGIKEDFISPLLDLTSLEHSQLSFDLAYSYHLYTPPYFEENTIFTDTLEISMSTDAGETFETIYRKAGDELLTADTPVTNALDINSCFFYPSENEWKNEVIDLGEYSNEDKAMFRFRYISGLGGSINIDNIKFEKFNTSSVKDDNIAGISVSPNPATDYIEISFGNHSVNKVLQPLVHDSEIAIYDVLGNVVWKSTMNTLTPALSLRAREHRINISHLPGGVYFVRFGDRVEKFVKK